MSISILEQNTVQTAANLARKLVEQIKPLLDELDVIYNSAGGVSSTLTQASLDGVAAFSGITKAQVDDGLFALTSTLKGDIATAYSQLAKLAARGVVN